MSYDRHALADMLDLAVPLRILTLQARGGPTDTDWDLVQMYGVNSLMMDMGAAQFSGASDAMDTPTWFDCLTQSIAVMAFVPGGIKVFDRRYVAHAQPAAGEQGA